MRNRGQFGTPARAVRDHFRALELAREILEAEHAQGRHTPGSRADLCGHCAKIRPPPSAIGRDPFD